MLQFLNLASFVDDFSFVGINRLNFNFVFKNLVTSLVNTLSTLAAPRHSDSKPNLGSATLAKAFNIVTASICHPILGPNIIRITGKLLMSILIKLISCVIGKVSICKQRIAATYTAKSLL